MQLSYKQNISGDIQIRTGINDLQSHSSTVELCPLITFFLY